MPLVTRQGKGSKLSIAEMDGNLTGLNSGQFIFEEFLTNYSGISETATGGFVGGTVIVPELVDIGTFLNSLQNELYEPFLGPITQTNVEIAVFGQIVEVDSDPDFTILFNGNLFSGEGVFGSGNMNALKQGDLLISQINSIPVSFTYSYNYDSGTGDHTHNFSIESVLTQLLKTTFEISVNDTATSWSDVTVNTYTLVTPV